MLETLVAFRAENYTGPNDSGLKEWGKTLKAKILKAQ